MKVFIWERLSNVTTNWHHEGGCVVIAESLEKAREQLHIHGVPVGSDAFAAEPDKTLPTGDFEDPDVFIFPDSGCC